MEESQLRDVRVARSRTWLPGRSQAVPLTGAFAGRGVTVAVIAALSVSALAIWVVLMTRLDVRAVDDLGVISIVPPPAFACVGLLTAAFVLSLRLRPLSGTLLAVQIVALVIMLYGAPAFFEEAPRFVTAWLHVGFTDAIARTGELFPLRDARFDWPAFFVLSAFVSSVSGLNPLGVLAWVPAAQTLLYLPPMYLILRSGTSDARMIWLGIWFFCLTNWVAQDYFSPQGLNLLLFLSIIAILLTWFRRPGRWPTPRWRWLARALNRVPGRLRDAFIDPTSTAVRRAQTLLSEREEVGLVAGIALLTAMSVASHQLTPFAILGAVVTLMVLGRIGPRTVGLVMLVLLSAWFGFMAVTFLSGHLGGLVASVGQANQNAAANVGDRLVGSVGHQVVVLGRIAFTAVIWLLALIGALRRLWQRRIDISLAVLAVVPFGLILLQSYGGEILLRIYLFSLPFVAFFVAAAFMPDEHRASWRLSVVVVLASMLMAAGFMLTRYGNEAYEMVTADEYQALQFVTAHADPGEPIAGVNTRVPLGYAEYEQHANPNLASFFRDDDIDGLVGAMRSRAPRGGYAWLVISRSQHQYARLVYGMSEQDWSSRVEELAQRATLEYVNPDAAVYRMEGFARR